MSHFLGPLLRISRLEKPPHIPLAPLTKTPKVCQGSPWLQPFLSQGDRERREGKGRGWEGEGGEGGEERGGQKALQL